MFRSALLSGSPPHDGVEAAPMRRERFGRRVAALAVAAASCATVVGVVLPASASPSATPAVSMSASTSRVAGGTEPSLGTYPTVFAPTGQWELVYTWPGHPTEHLLESFAADPTRTSTFGYQVYRSTECDLDRPGPLLDGKIWAEFYVEPQGMLFSGLRPGNGPTQSDGDMGSLAGRAPNDTSVPLTFSGSWLNARGPGGTFTLSRLSRPEFCHIVPASTPTVSHVGLVRS